MVVNCKILKSVLKKAVAFVLLVVIFCLLLGCEKKKETVYIVAPQVWKSISGLSPEEFIEVQDTWFSSKENFCEDARVGSDGNLLLTMTESQEIAWLGFYNRAFKDAEEQGFVIAGDYKSITVNSYKETLAADTTIAFLAAYSCLTRQILNGCDVNDVYVDLVFVDANTNEVRICARWPYEKVTVTSEDAEVFSSIYENKSYGTVVN